jgi:hypothetical protein
MVCAPFTRFPRIALFGMAVLALFAGGCTVPTSEHPLSDEKTSILDERLIGHWDFASEPAQAIDPMRFVVGRDPGAASVLEYVAPSLGAEQKIEIHRGRLFVAKIGDSHYLSFNGDDPKQGYSIMRYEYKPYVGNAQAGASPAPQGPPKQNLDTVEFHLLIDTVIADAIEKGELAGKVTRDKSSRRLQQIRITAKPDEIRAFIEKNAARCFTTEAFKMVRLKGA